MFEGVGDGNMLGIRATVTRHKRSKSFPEKKREKQEGLGTSSEASHIKLGMGHFKESDKIEKKEPAETEVQSCLKQEILQLEKRLQEQFAVRRAMEQALGYGTFSYCVTSEMSMTKPAAELIKEIAVLELEVVYLEQYLLCLYRKAFDQKTSPVSPSAKYQTPKSPITPRKRFLDLSRSNIKSKRETASQEMSTVSSSARCEMSKSPVTTPRQRLLGVSRSDAPSKKETSAIQSGHHLHERRWKESIGVREEEKIQDATVHRCHSNLSQHSTFSTRNAPPAESLERGVRACHSQPPSMIEYAQNTSNAISLAEHLGTRISDHVPETPNKLSEDMIKCMSAIYIKLSDPSLTHNGLSSPISSLSSVGGFSPQDHCDMWSPGFKNNSSFDVRLDNPFLIEGLKEFSGPYSTMLEVPWIYRDSQKLGDVEHLLQNFRSLVCRLEEVNPTKLKHEERLAFWINIHNVLVMHAFLAYGIPQNNIKRLFLILKAAYNVGGHTISADTIQSSILGCRMSRPGQWLRLLVSSRLILKTGNQWRAYAIEHQEPLLHFALSTGNHSDPAVRVYTPKGVFQELEAAKQEYIQATFGMRKNQKILLPKIVESFAKDSGLCHAGIVEMIQQSLPENLRKSIKKCQLGKSRKTIEWIPHNFAFRYLISKDLAR